MIAALALKRRAAGVRIGIDGEALTLEADAAPPPTILAAEVAAIICLLGSSSFHKRSKTAFVMLRASWGNWGGSWAATSAAGSFTCRSSSGFAAGRQPS